MNDVELLSADSSTVGSQHHPETDSLDFGYTV